MIININNSEQKDKSKCVIISGGLWNDDAYHLQVLQKAKMIICADSGAGYALRLGIKPDVVIGDFDSLTQDEIDELKKLDVELIKYPPQKEYTDTYLALQKALELRYKRIEIVACLGGRFDHALSNVMLLTIPEVRDIDIRILEPSQEIFLVKPHMRLAGKKGDTISLLPLTPEVSGITASGLYYQVPKGMFKMGISNGVSNVFTEDVVELSVEKGLLLAIHIKKEKSGNFRFLFD